MMNRILLKIYRASVQQTSYVLMTVAVFIATFILAVLMIAENRASSGIDLYGKQLMGADLIVSSDQGMPKKWQQLANHYHLQTLKTYQWITMGWANQSFQLVTVHAIPQGFPLIGNIKAHNPDDQPSIPKSGQVWIAVNLAKKLQLKLNDTLQLGDHAFNISAIVPEKPFQMTSFRSSFAPTIYLNQSDLANLDIFKQGAQINQQLFVAGQAKSIAEFIGSLKPTLQAGQKIRSLASLENFGERFKQSTTILALFGWIGLIFSAIVVALASTQYLAKQRQTIALLASFGVAKHRIIRHFSLLCWSASMIGILGAVCLAWTLQFPLQALLPSWINESLPIQPFWQASYQPILLSLLLTASFLAPRLLELNNMKVLDCFSSGPSTQPIKIQYFLISIIPLLACLFYLVGQKYGALFLTYLIELVALLLAVGYGCLSVLKRIRPQVSIMTRCAIQFMIRYWHHHAMQLIATGLTSSLLFLWLLSQHALTTNWSQKLPQHTPNLFLLDIMPNQLDPLTHWFNLQKLTMPNFYPAIRGRLTALNSTPIKQAVEPKMRRHNALNRSLTLSEGTDIPIGNKIVAGQWSSNPTVPEVSIEQKFAQELGFKIGDRLTFTINEDQLTATVSSIRSLDWMTFTPNFYCFFPAKTLSHFNRTFFASFFMPSNQQLEKLPDFYQKFPNITLLNLSKIFSEIQALTLELSQWLKALLLLLFALSLLVYYQCLTSQRQQRHHDLEVLFHMGATRLQRRASFLFEQLTVTSIGVIAGLAISQLISSLLIQNLFKISLTFNPLLFGGTLLSLLAINTLFVLIYFKTCDHHLRK